MAIETLGEAWKLGWRVRAHCYWGGPNKSGRRSAIYCDTRIDLDMATLVWTRGEAFPLDQLASRLKCPKCGLMKVRVYFQVPNQPNANAVASK